VVEEDREIGLEAIAPSDVADKSIAAQVERADPECILIVRYDSCSTCAVGTGNVDPWLNIIGHSVLQAR
jgi:hypothetical protein